MPDKPHAPATERNRAPILEVLRECFADSNRVLEIGSGTGEHAVHFAAQMPWLTWQCSDLAENLPGIRDWLTDAGLSNTPTPLELDAARLAAADAPSIIAPGAFDAAFSANTLHIMGWADVELLFKGFDRALADAATLVIYGPFNRDGAYTSDSNRAFDGCLKEGDPRSGIRDLEAATALADAIGLGLITDRAMPANNRCLVWRRGAATN